MPGGFEAPRARAKDARGPWGTTWTAEHRYGYPSPKHDRTADLEQRVAELERRLACIESALTEPTSETFAQ